MKFFIPEDFEQKDNYFFDRPSQEMAALMANAKLEREGKVVYGYYGNENEPKDLVFRKDQLRGDFPSTHQALLINIEPIEKCKHPAERVKITGAVATESLTANSGISFFYKCECGAIVKPKEFEEVK